MPGKSIGRIVGVTVVFLLVPLIAMQFTDQVSWTVADFVAAAALLLGTGLIYELVVSKIGSRRYKVIFALVLLAALLFIWTSLAVGFLGD
ncbi:MAG: hypothetical protein JWN38_1105 [Candidatus Saccharibacteria bacterium]|nr:hypothetical protein [Candidatus Saccharibacteria bacterium]